MKDEEEEEEEEEEEKRKERIRHTFGETLLINFYTRERGKKKKERERFPFI